MVWKTKRREAYACCVHRARLDLSCLWGPAEQSELDSVLAERETRIPRAFVPNGTIPHDALHNATLFAPVDGAF